ncbi:MAG: pitrilysin family protein, partial [Myxococcota bacterium]
MPACSGGANRVEVIPTLPGDGDTNTAKPPPAPPVTKPDDPWAEREDLIAGPPAKAPRAVALPSIERFTLPNGLSVIAIKDARLPVVNVQLAVRAGQVDSPRDKMGVAQLTAQMLRRGTRTRSASRIADEVDYAGASLSTSAGFEFTLISCSVRSENVRTCLNLVPDVTVNATFPAADMDQVKQQLLAVVGQRKDSAGQLADAHLSNLLWGEEHVRGWPMSGRTVAAITRDDLVRWHRSWFAPNNAVVVVAGDIDSKRLRLEFNRSLRWWQRRNLPTRPSFSEPDLTGTKVRLIDKPGQTQSHIRIGQLGIAHGDPAYFDHLVFDYALGGGAFASRLMQVVRAAEGKAYGASTRFDRHASRGEYVTSTF